MSGGLSPKVLAGWCALGVFWACGSDDKHPSSPRPASGEGGEAGEAAGTGGVATAGKGGSAGRGMTTAGRGGTGQMGGQGGEGGEMTSAGKGGSAAGKGGSAGTMPMEEGGMGGEGGTAEHAGASCTACATASCASVLARCDGSPRCRSWLDCINACDDDACLSSCDDDASDTVLLTTSVYECLCSASTCTSACSELDVCGKSCTEGQGPPASSGAPGTAPALLTDTGLYTRATDSDPWTLAPWVQAFQPEYVLWSDGAEKERYIYLPRCQPIDTTDMDHWSFPVGTRIWKQFTRDNVRVETRLLERFGTGVSDWVMASYQWALPVGNEPLDPEQAVLASSSGVPNANGTTHDIPAVVGGCQNCHGKLSERVLGFSAIQLSHSLSGLTFSQLADRGMISNAPVRGGYNPPGDATTQAALGYLHTNCGNCHNETGVGTASPSMWLRLLVNQSTLALTHVQATAINHATGNPNFPYDRIEPTMPASSSIILRMQRNPSMGETLQMPPVGRKLPDPTGIAAVSAWITGLTL